MAFQNRPLSSNLRHPSMGGANASTSQSPVLVARVNEKKAELESLKQLRDLSGGLAAQMQALEDKLSTLSDGTEAMAAVLSNWHSVMQAINMASAKLPKPAGSEENPESKDVEEGVSLPQTLVRIPVTEDETSSATNEQDRKA